jgi:hypothetical protein
MSGSFQIEILGSGITADGWGMFWVIFSIAAILLLPPLKRWLEKKLK